MNFVKKDRFYLENKIKDLDWVFKEFNYLFDNGAILAGGSVRAALTTGSIKDIIIRSTDGENKPDIDFFFSSDKDYKTCSELILKKSVSKVHDSKYADSYLVKQNKMFATKRFKVQLIKPSFFKGPAEETIKRFDIINCMIAIDSNHTYICDRILEIEEKKILVLNQDAEIKRQFSDRIIKYCNKGYESIEDNGMFLKHAFKYDSLYYLLYKDVINKIPLDSLVQLFGLGQGSYNDHIIKEIKRRSN